MNPVRVIYDDGRPGHQGVMGTVIEMSSTVGMAVKWEDRVSPSSIGWKDRGWMDHIRPVCPKCDAVAEWCDKPWHGCVCDCQRRPPAEPTPRFVWCFGDGADYPDIPRAVFGRRWVALWDRKAKGMVCAVSADYARLFALEDESKEGGTPFADLEAWLNGLQPEALKGKELPF